MANGNISVKQQEILEYLKEVILKKGYPPSVREICTAVGLSSTSSVFNHLEKIMRMPSGTYTITWMTIERNSVWMSLNHCLGENRT